MSLQYSDGFSAQPICHLSILLASDRNADVGMRYGSRWPIENGINPPLSHPRSICSYNTYSNEVGYGSPYGYSSSVTPQQNMGYDISADYVDSTTTYEPRSTIIDPDFIGGHSK